MRNFMAKNKYIKIDLNRLKKTVQEKIEDSGYQKFVEIIDKHYKKTEKKLLGY